MIWLMREREGGWLLLELGGRRRSLRFGGSLGKRHTCTWGHPPHRFRRRYTLGTSVRSGNPAAVVPKPASRVQ